MKVIIYSQRVEIVKSYNERRDCADQKSPELIDECGYLPVPLPNINVGREYIDEIEPAGIILTGGNSLVCCGGEAPERDETDLELIQLAIEKDIPIYGFCRGMLSILHYFGEKIVEVNNHVAVHHNITGKIQENVNSYHNQGCIELSGLTGLVALAKTEDGVIEFIGHKTYKIMGTMWHPEREYPFRESDINRIKQFFN